jgi:predicted extracellular nuclease
MNRISHVALLSATCFVTGVAGATVLVEDAFNYADGNLVGNGGWLGHSGSGSFIQVSSGQAVIAHGSGSRQDANLGFADQTSGTLYAGFDFSVDPDAFSGSDFEYFAHFKDNGTNFRSRVDLIAPTGAGDFSVGFANSSSTHQVSWASDLDFDTSYRAVMSFDLDADKGSLWIDPASATSASISDTSVSVTSMLNAFALRQSDSSADETVRIDNLTIAATFDEAVSGPAGDGTGGGGAGGGSGAPLLKVGEIQGSGHTSPQDGNTVATQGVVTALKSNGFYLQEPGDQTDGNPDTSDAIFVFTGGVPAVAIGDSVQVKGTVTEYFPGGVGTGNLSTTEIVGPTVTPIAGLGTVATTVLGDGGRPIPNTVIDDDGLSSYDPASDGIDFFESHEGMLVQVNHAVATSPTSRFGEISVIADNGTHAGVRTDAGGVTVQPGDFNPERIIVDDGIVDGEPLVGVGDAFDGAITGVIDYSFGEFKLLNTTSLPDVRASGNAPETTSLRGDEDRLTVASYNVLNLDPGDADAKFDGIAGQIVNNLRAPDIIGLQEMQDNSGPTDDGVVSAAATAQKLIDSIVAAGGPAYEYVEIAPLDKQEGGQPGANIRVGYLYNPARVGFDDSNIGASNEAITVIDNGGELELSRAAGRVDPANPAFTDGGDGSAAEAEFADTRRSLAAVFTFNGQKIVVVNNHFKSKGGDDPLTGATQPPETVTEAQRTEQAQVINAFIDEMLAIDPSLMAIVLGDLNEFDFREPLQELAGVGADQVLHNLIDDIALSDRYTFIFNGNSQVLDHMLVTDALLDEALFDIVHANVDFAPVLDGSGYSDHDPIVASFRITAAEVPVPAPLLLMIAGAAHLARRMQVTAR